MSTLTIRRIEPHECETFRAMRLRALAESPEAFGSTYAKEVDQPEEFWRERVQAAALSGDRAMFVAQLDGQLVGMAGCLRDDRAAPVPPPWRDDAAVGDRPAWVVSMWVAHEGRRQGTGAHLLERVIAWAAERGSDVINLVVIEGNEPATSLYTRFGFRPHGPLRPHPHLQDAREMHMVRAL